MGLEDFLNEFKDYINKPLPKSVKHKTGLIDYAILSMLDLKLNTVFGEIEVMIDVGKEFSSLAMYKDVKTNARNSIAKTKIILFGPVAFTATAAPFTTEKAGVRSCTLAFAAWY